MAHNRKVGHGYTFLGAKKGDGTEQRQMNVATFKQGKTAFYPPGGRRIACFVTSHGAKLVPGAGK
ncbi:hypothetical protein [Roseovarius pacificus]|uniref:hypothetical protein n=1 Tax=Roseovarius pacificus TaxID=337701 RepID=UPI002A18A3AA|nr:hypothetical protein [Roseovarius pacificus]